MNHLKLSPLFILLLFGSCMNTRVSQHAPGEQKAAENISGKPQLVFINFLVAKDSTLEHSVIHITKINITDGRIKKENLPGIYKPEYPNSLRFVIVGDHEKTPYETVIEHPLFRSYEYAMDNGEIGMKKVVLAETSFFIRVNYNPGMKYIHVFEKLSSSEEKEIATLELKQ
jgi:hypothetical protein